MKTFDPSKCVKYRVESNDFNVVIVGVGGTGGYVIRDLCRLAYSLKPRKNLSIHLIDPDIVEQKNVLRQNFLECDIGRPKAEVLAERYGNAFGLDISFTVDKFPKVGSPAAKGLIKANCYNIIIGCVDNNAARRDINEWRTAVGFIWIDSGNESRNGQVIVGSPNYSLSSRGQLPCVTELYPEILNPAADPVDTTSCAERAQVDIQNIFVNLTAATYILNFMNTITSGKDSYIHGIEFTIGGATTPIYLGR